MKHIMIIGATGVFGSRLAMLLNKEPQITLVLAARALSNLRALSAKLHKRHICRPIDRNMISSDDLQDIDLVIDAAGPFQRDHDFVIMAAIQARCNYIDLADGREFIANIKRFDEAAHKADIAIVSGVSSIPALSHAVIDRLRSGLCSIDDIYVGIFPGNRAPRGLSVVQSILSYAGRPVRVFKDGRWQDLLGWGGSHRRDIPFAGKRWASICDTPEQDLLVAAYHPKRNAEFYAGMDLSLLHLGLSLLALPVRWNWFHSLEPASKLLLWLAQRFLPFGSDVGAMDIEISGQDHTGKTEKKRWVLKADANHGPNVPIFAAAIVARRLAAGVALPKGARACCGLIELDEFQPDFARFNIKTMLHHNAPSPSAGMARGLLQRISRRIVSRFPFASRFLTV